MEDCNDWSEPVIRLEQNHKALTDALNDGDKKKAWEAALKMEAELVKVLDYLRMA